MINKASEYIPIAEKIHTRELNAKLEVERLYSRQSELDQRHASLNQRIAYLEASIEAEMCRLREEYEDSSASRHHLEFLRCQKVTCEIEILGIIREMDSVREKLIIAKEEADAAEAEKLRALIEVQTQAKITVDNSRKLQGMTGSFAGAGAVGIGLLQQRYAALQQAANILGGAVPAGISRGKTGSGVSAARPAAAQHGHGAVYAPGPVKNGAATAAGGAKDPAGKVDKTPSCSSATRPVKRKTRSSPGVLNLAKKKRPLKRPQKPKNAAPRTAYRKSSKSGDPDTKWHFYPPHIMRTAYVLPYRERRYNGTITFTTMDDRKTHSFTINRKVYQYTKLDPEMVVPAGSCFVNGMLLKQPMTNLELMLKGNSPFVWLWDDNGNKKLVQIELHHLTGEETLRGASYFGTSDTDGPLMELPNGIHKQFDKPLHIPDMPSFRKKADGSKGSLDEKKYKKFREQYWISRALEYLENQNSGTVSAKVKSDVYPV